MITEETLDTLDATVGKLIAADMLPEAREAARQLGDWHPIDLAALRRGVAVYRKAKSFGGAFVLIEQFRVSFSDDLDAALD